MVAAPTCSPPLRLSAVIPDKASCLRGPWFPGRHGCPSVTRPSRTNSGLSEASAPCLPALLCTAPTHLSPPGTPHCAPAWPTLSCDLLLSSTARQLGSEVSVCPGPSQPLAPDPCPLAQPSKPLYTQTALLCPLRPWDLHSCHMQRSHQGHQTCPTQQGGPSWGSALGWETKRNKPQDQRREGL